MAGTGKKITMQGLGTPVSATGQGGKAGPQSSSSSDRSSTRVGNLASEEYNATRMRTYNHECEKNSDEFCYVCGKFEVIRNRRSISDTIKSLYQNCFDIEITNQDKPWVPHIICASCRKMLSQWNKDRKADKLKFTKPMIWSEPKSQETCYFCMTNKGNQNLVIKSKIEYAQVSSVNHSSKAPIVPIENESEPMDVDNSRTEEEDDEMLFEGNSEEEEESDSEEEYLPEGKDKRLKTFNQKELNDLVRNLGLPKDGAEYLAAALKKKFTIKRN